MAICLVQARMSSSRLPGKVMKEILSKPMILYQIERLRRAKKISDVIVLTSNDKTDDVLVDLLTLNSVNMYRGSLNNVYDRFTSYLLSQNLTSETVVRVTADCPLIDWNIIDQAIDFFESSTFDYLSNTINRTFPRGLDLEVFKASTLINASCFFNLTYYDKEHVTPIFYTNPQFYKIGNFSSENNNSNLRWTVDTATDFDFVKVIFENLYPLNNFFSTEEIMKFLVNRPELNNYEKQ